MKSNKIVRLGVIVLGLLAVLYFARSGFGVFSDAKLLAGALFLEILIVCIWKYEQRFFLLLMVAFAWAGMTIPLRGVWIAGRWAVLAAAAVAGFIVWMRRGRLPFAPIHLLALFCAGSAFVSATVSPFAQLASSKALSLFLLLLYGATGARAAAVGREEHFFKGLLWGCEIVVYASAIAYFVLGEGIWGNPNSLGAVMSVAVFPILLWGWFTSEVGSGRWRRLTALLLCTFLICFSWARASMVAMVLVTLAFCIGLRQHRLLLRMAGAALFLVILMGLVNPAALTESALAAKDAVLYKGHKEKGLLGSRQEPWEETVSTIRQHPWFGAGYGTSPSEENRGYGAGRFSSTAETSREHGSSYLTILEWVGLLGVLPFVALVALNAVHVLRVMSWMRRTGHASHYSVPLAMVLLAGFGHAVFEDWMFAVGYYLCVYFWALAFVLADHLPWADAVHVSSSVPAISPASAMGVGANASGR